MAKETNADILLTLGIDTSSLTGLRQTIQAELSKHNFSISITGLDQKNVTDTANQLKQINAASEALNKAQLVVENARLKVEEKRLDLLNKREEKLSKVKAPTTKEPDWGSLKDVGKEEVSKRTDLELLNGIKSRNAEEKKGYEEWARGEGLRADLSKKRILEESDAHKINQGLIRKEEESISSKEKRHIDLMRKRRAEEEDAYKINEKFNNAKIDAIRKTEETNAKSHLADISRRNKENELQENAIRLNKLFDKEKDTSNNKGLANIRKTEESTARSINAQGDWARKYNASWDSAIKQNEKLNKERIKLSTAPTVAPESEFLVALKWASIYTVMYTGIRTAKAAVLGLGEAMIQVDEAAILLQRDLKLSADQMQHGLKVAMEEAASMGQKYGQSMTDVIRVQDRFAKQGMSLPDIFKATEATLVGASTSLMATADTAQFLSVVMKAFKLDVNDAMGVMDKLNEVSKNYNITAQDLALALQHTGSSARLVGMSVDDTIGIITAIAVATGRAGAEIGNSVRTMTSFIYRPDTIKTLEGMRFAVRDLTGKGFRPFNDILGDVAKRWKTLNDIEQESIVTAIGGTLRREQLLSVMEGYDVVQKSTTTSTNSFLSALKEIKVMEDSVTYQTNQLKTAWQEFAKSLGDNGGLSVIKGTLGIISSMLQGMSNAVKGVSPVIAAVVDTIVEKNVQAESEMLRALNIVENRTKRIDVIDALLSKDKEKLSHTEVANALAGLGYQTSKIDKMSTEKQLIDKLKAAREKEVTSLKDNYVASQHILQISKSALSDSVKIGLNATPILERILGPKEPEQALLNRVATSTNRIIKDEERLESHILSVYQSYLVYREEIQKPVVTPNPDLHTKEWDQLQIQVSKITEKSDEIKWDLTPDKEKLEITKKILAANIATKASIDESERKATADEKYQAENKAARQLRKNDLSEINDAISANTIEVNRLNKAQIDVDHSMDSLVSKTEIFNDKTKTALENNVASSHSYISVFEAEKRLLSEIYAKSILGMDLTDKEKLLLSKKDLMQAVDNAILDKKRDLIEQEVQLQKEQQQSSRNQYLLKLKGLKEEDILMQESKRLLVDYPNKQKESEDLAWRAFEARMNKVLAVSEKMTGGIADTIITMFDTSKVRQPLVEFGNTFKSIFAEVMKEQLVESMMPSMNKAFGITTAFIEGSETTYLAITSAFSVGSGMVAGAGGVTKVGAGVSQVPATPTGTDAGWWSKHGGTVASLGMVGIQSIQSQQAGVKNAYAPLIGTAIGAALVPVLGPLAPMIGGMVGSLFTKPKKDKPAPVQDPMLEVIHRDLEYVNRNLIAMKKPLEMYALPASYYFSARPIGGVQNQSINVTVYAADGTDAGTQISGILARNSRMAFQGVA